MRLTTLLSSWSSAPVHGAATMYIVYTLEGSSGRRLYIGFTEDIKKRLEKHNEGAVLSTKRFRPWKIIYLEVFVNKYDALRRERYFKTTKGKTTLKQLIRNYLEQ